MKCKPRLVPRIFKYSVNAVKDIIISLSLPFFVDVVRMTLQSYTYITWMYLFPLLEVVGKHTHIYESVFPYFVVLGSPVVQNITFLYIFFRVYIRRYFFG